MRCTAIPTTSLQKLQPWQALWSSCPSCDVQDREQPALGGGNGNKVEQEFLAQAGILDTVFVGKHFWKTHS